MKGVMWHNGEVGIVLVTRSGSHTIFKQILQYHHPENDQTEKNNSSSDQTIWHPVKNLSNLHDIACNPHVLDKQFAVMVRDPLERFRSAVQEKSVLQWRA